MDRRTTAAVYVTKTVVVAVEKFCNTTITKLMRHVHLVVLRRRPLWLRGLLSNYNCWYNFWSKLKLLIQISISFFVGALCYNKFWYFSISCLLLTLKKERIVKNGDITYETTTNKDFCFRYLASGTSITYLQYQYRLAKSIISIIVSQVCKAICGNMMDLTKLSRVDWKDVDGKSCRF